MILLCTLIFNCVLTISHPLKTFSITENKTELLYGMKWQICAPSLMVKYFSRKDRRPSFHVVNRQYFSFCEELLSRDICRTQARSTCMSYFECFSATIILRCNLTKTDESTFFILNVDLVFGRNWVLRYINENAKRSAEWILNLCIHFQLLLHWKSFENI